MTEIIVRLCKPSNDGRLYYRHDSEIGPDILLIQNPHCRPRAYSINIEGGRLLLHFDAQRILQDIQFRGRWKYWQKTSSLIEPLSSEPFDIVLAGVQSVPGLWEKPYLRKRSDGSLQRHYAYDLEVAATTDTDFSSAHIRLGSAAESSRWVTLSEQCWAQISDNHLKGFLVKFTDKPIVLRDM